MDRGFDTEETLTRVYEEFFPKIYNYVYYQIHNRAVTDDLVSSIFMKVVEHIESFNEQKASFSTWIFNISSYDIEKAALSGGFQRADKPIGTLADDEKGRDIFAKQIRRRTGGVCFAEK